MSARAREGVVDALTADFSPRRQPSPGGSDVAGTPDPRGSGSGTKLRAAWRRVTRWLELLGNGMFDAFIPPPAPPRPPTSSELIAHHLGRIADALQTSPSLGSEATAPADGDSEPTRDAGSVPAPQPSPSPRAAGESREICGAHFGPNHLYLPCSLDPGHGGDHAVL